MALTEQELIDRALGSLTDTERSRSIVYLDEKRISPGKGVKFGNAEIDVPWPAIMFFVDLEPGVNWGHKCRYLLMNSETGQLSTVPAQFPPFLKGTSPTLRL